MYINRFILQYTYKYIYTYTNTKVHACCYTFINTHSYARIHLKYTFHYFMFDVVRIAVVTQIVSRLDTTRAKKVLCHIYIYIYIYRYISIYIYIYIYVTQYFFGTRCVQSRHYLRYNSDTNNIKHEIMKCVLQMYTCIAMCVYKCIATCMYFCICICIYVFISIL